MRWERGRRSDNVEDRRGMRMPRGAVGGGIGLLLLIAVALFLGVDPSDVVNTGIQPSGGTEPYHGSRAASPEEDRLADFVAVVLGDTEDTWHTLFRQMGQSYREPALVLFSGAVESACGFAQAAVGPFYCPRDQKVYLDMSFFGDLQNRFRAPGDFARAYVIAHEIGHHVQKLMGIADQVDDLSHFQVIEGTNDKNDLDGGDFLLAFLLQLPEEHQFFFYPQKCLFFLGWMNPDIS